MRKRKAKIRTSGQASPKKPTSSRASANPFAFQVAEAPPEYAKTKRAANKGLPAAAEPYFYEREPGVKLIIGDCIEIMSKAPAGCVDMIFADPPYFLSNNGITCHAGRMVSVNKGKWDASKGAVEDHEFVKKWLAECKRLLKPDGTIWVSGTLHIIYSVGYAMQELGYKILNDIIWEKPNPPPHLACRYFAHSTEIVLWARKSQKARHFFDYALMKKTNGGKQMKNVWRIKPPSRHEKRYGKHPTQKPVGLLERIILASTRSGDLVLDPFLGSGTTGVAAIRQGRRFVGIEKEEEYISVARSRIEDIIAESASSLFALEGKGQI